MKNNIFFLQPTNQSVSHHHHLTPPHHYMHFKVLLQNMWIENKVMDDWLTEVPGADNSSMNMSDLCKTQKPKDKEHLGNVKKNPFCSYLCEAVSFQ